MDEYSPSVLGKEPLSFERVDSVAPPPDVEMEHLELGEPPVISPENASMELDGLICDFDECSLERMEDRHIAFLNSIYNKKDEVKVWTAVKVGGSRIYVARPPYVISDVDGSYLDVDMSVKWMGVECESTTLMEVGDPVNEAAAKAYCRANGIHAITCHWVCVQKDESNVRMGMVAREVAIAKGRESARTLMMSSPTSSVESLKLMLSQAADCDLSILGL